MVEMSPPLVGGGNTIETLNFYGDNSVHTKQIYGQKDDLTGWVHVKNIRNVKRITDLIPSTSYLNLTYLRLENSMCDHSIRIPQHLCPEVNRVYSETGQTDIQ